MAALPPLTPLADPPPPDDGPRRPWLLRLGLAATTVAIVAALATSQESGTGSVDVGGTGDDEGAAEAQPRTRSCEATTSNPGGDNNYIPDAPVRGSLGEGFVIRGTVRAAAGCRPLEGVRVQVWLATQTGTERDNRASTLTNRDGRYRIETDPTIAQFGGPNVHIAYDGEGYRSIFIRRVVDLDDDRATVNLTLAR